MIDCIIDDVLEPTLNLYRFTAQLNGKPAEGTIEAANAHDAGYTSSIRVVRES